MYHYVRLIWLRWKHGRRWIDDKEIRCQQMSFIKADNSKIKIIIEMRFPNEQRTLQHCEKQRECEFDTIFFVVFCDGDEKSSPHIFKSVAQWHTSNRKRTAHKSMIVIKLNSPWMLRFFFVIPRSLIVVCLSVEHRKRLISHIEYQK